MSREVATVPVVSTSFASPPRSPRAAPIAFGGRRGCLGWLLALAASLGCTATSNNAVPGSLPSTLPDGGRSTADGAVADGARDAALDGPAADGNGPDANGFDAFINGKPLGYLWFAGAGLGAFLREETLASREHGPGYIVQPSFEVRSYHDLAFDAAGNLWAVPTSGNQVVRLPAQQLGRGSVPPMPDLVIHSDGLQSPQSLTFDARGRLWVLNYAASGFSTANVVRFDDATNASGTVTLAPALTLEPDSTAVEQARFNQANALAFDRDGNLWVAAVANVLRIDHATSLDGHVLATEGAVLSGGEAYAGLAFDTRGSLWVTGAGGGYWALRFDRPGALTGATKPVPAARLRLPNGTATFAGGVVAESDDSLWIAMSNQLLKVPAASTLSGEVTLSPAVVLGLVGLPDLASKLALWPPAPLVSP